MATVYHILSHVPNDPKNRYLLNRSGSVREIALSLNGGEDFTLPTICKLNGDLLLRKDWGIEVKQDDVLVFSTVLGTLLGIVLALIAGFAAASLLKPQIPGSIPEPDPVYTLRGQSNQIKLSMPIERPYGRFRLFPSYASIAYNRYVDNDQYLYALYCLGQGSFASPVYYFDDTPVTAFEEVTVNTVNPGESTTLFADNVITSSEVGGIELFAPNEPEYEIVGPFVANPAETRTTRLEFDLAMPRGLNKLNDEGKLRNWSTQVKIEARQIDDSGNPVSPFSVIYTFDKTLATANPQRFTLSVDVAEGRYEVQAYRTINKQEDETKYSDTIEWQLLRAYLPSVGDYGDVTIVELEARADNNLNDNTRNQFNAITTAKLPTWDPEAGWSAEPEETRSAVWALCDVIRSKYGSGLSAERYLDLDDLYEVDTALAAEQRYFDFSFDTSTTCWEAIKTICSAVRALPIMRGQKVSMHLIRAQETPDLIFNPNNIIKDSFSISTKFRSDADYDSVEVTYMDSDTWAEETILCYDETISSGERPEQVKLVGITSRTWAYREGMRLFYSLYYENQTIKFSTGKEGNLATEGMVIGINHEAFSWGKTGQVLAVDGTNTVVTLDRIPDLDVGVRYAIIFRGLRCQPVGYFTFIFGGTSTITLESPLEDVIMPDYPADLPFYGISEIGQEYYKARVTNVSPGEEETEIEAVIYEDIVFSMDSAQAPDRPYSGSIIETSKVPAVSGLSLVVDTFDPDLLYVSWTRAAGADRYVIQWGDTAGVYTEQTITTNEYVRIPYQYDFTHVRVAAVGDGQGPWAYIEYGANWVTDGGDLVVDDLGQIIIFNNTIS